MEIAGVDTVSGRPSGAPIGKPFDGSRVKMPAMSCPSPLVPGGPLRDSGSCPSGRNETAGGDEVQQTRHRSVRAPRLRLRAQGSLAEHAQPGQPRRTCATTLRSAHAVEEPAPPPAAARPPSPTITGATCGRSTQAATPASSIEPAPQLLRSAETVALHHQFGHLVPLGVVVEHHADDGR